MFFCRVKNYCGKDFDMTNHQPTDPPTDEIVPWLRFHAEHASRARYPEWRMFRAAADAIERLTTERDEARRWFCQHVELPLGGDGTLVAKGHGWDCFRDTIAEGDKGGIAP
jgi:hypothetical protein